MGSVTVSERPADGPPISTPYPHLRTEIRANSVEIHDVATPSQVRRWQRRSAGAAIDQVEGVVTMLRSLIPSALLIFVVAVTVGLTPLTARALEWRPSLSGQRFQPLKPVTTQVDGHAHAATLSMRELRATTIRAEAAAAGELTPLFGNLGSHQPPDHDQLRPRAALLRRGAEPDLRLQPRRGDPLVQGRHHPRPVLRDVLLGDRARPRPEHQRADGRRGRPGGAGGAGEGRRARIGRQPGRAGVHPGAGHALLGRAGRRPRRARPGVRQRDARPGRGSTPTTSTP